MKKTQKVKSKDKSQTSYMKILNSLRSAVSADYSTVIHKEKRAIVLGYDWVVISFFIYNTFSASEIFTQKFWFVVPHIADKPPWDSIYAWTVLVIHNPSLNSRSFIQLFHKTSLSILACVHICKSHVSCLWSMKTTSQALQNKSIAH